MYGLVTPQLIDNLRSCFALFKDDLHHALQPSAVQIHQRLHKAEGACSHSRIRCRLNSADKLFDLLKLLLKLFLVEHKNIEAICCQVKLAA